MAAGEALNTPNWRRLAGTDFFLARQWVWGWLLCLCLLSATAAGAQSVAADEAPLVIGQRTIHVFRAPLGMYTVEERADAARHRIERAFQQAGEGWTSVRPVDQGLQVELDGKPMFFVLPGDARPLAGETPEDLANQASRMLQKAWSEARERADPRTNVSALLRVLLAVVVTVALLVIATRLLTSLRRTLRRRLLPWMHAGVFRHLGHSLSRLIPTLIDRLLLLLSWLLGLLIMFLFLAYVLGQFALTRVAGESLQHSITHMGGDALTAIASALPGMFVAALIFLAAWLAARITTEFFASVEVRADDDAWLNSHTAPATRRIVNAVLWLFALAMAYPYLPGSHTEAFKGLSVLVGLMVTIGASGVVGQVASGLILVYTYALKKGEYVRIQEHEGVVTELSLFVTRLRNGLGEEIAIPNALVLGNVTRNFSRAQKEGGCLLDTTVTIGYDTHWRQVHALLLEAAGTVPEICQEPAPYVVQTALSDFYVAYKLVVQLRGEPPANRALAASALHAAIQDSFNRHGVQIMSPHYLGDPATPKLVPEAGWRVPPA